MASYLTEAEELEMELDSIENELDLSHFFGNDSEAEEAHIRQLINRKNWILRRLERIQ